MKRVVEYGLVLSSLFLTAGFLAPLGCGSSSAQGTGGTTGAATGGTGGDDDGGTGGAATGGETGTGGATGSGGSGALPFMAVNPCNSADAYTAGTSIAYGGPGLTYTPKCLKVAVGAQVTFAPATSGDSFSVHPLNHSQTRGTLPSPITETMTGTMATFTFPTPGFYAYYCEFHGSADDGNFMAGVIWVE